MFCVRKWAHSMEHFNPVSHLPILSEMVSKIIGFRTNTDTNTHERIQSCPCSRLIRNHTSLYTRYCALLVLAFFCFVSRERSGDSHLKMTVTRIVPSNWVLKRSILVLFSDFLRIQEPPTRSDLTRPDPTDRPTRPTKKKAAK